LRAEEFDRRFETGEDVTRYLDIAGARRPGQEIKRVNVDFPLWMIKSLDREARRLGVPRQSIIKVWVADRLQKVKGV
jgi:hypothetical protein